MTKHKCLPVLWFFLGFGIFMFSRCSRILPFSSNGIAVIIGPIFSFKQIASIAGLWGFVFIFPWFASIINYGWENGFKWTNIKKITLIFLSILLAIVLFGTIKISLSDDSDTVKIASIILLPEAGKTVDAEGLFSREPSPYDETISRIENLANVASMNNAKIVTFQETAIKIIEENEAKLRNQIKRIAEEKDIYLSVSYGVFPEEGKGWNKHILVNNKGEVEIDYKKRYLRGLGNIGETRIYKKGPGVIQTTDTPYGRIGASI